MNSLDTQLARLLKSAAAAPAPGVLPLPFAVESRILAAWRQEAPDSELAAIVALFRRGLVCACGVAALVAAVCWFNVETASNSLAVEEFALSSDAITIALAR